MIYEQLAKLPSDHGIYGLIHYDFETDNVFYEQETGQFYPIDFDDAVYHWYVQDIERALDSLNESLIERLNEQFNHESGSLNDRLQDNPSDQQNDDEVIQRTREEKIRLRLDAAYVAFINGYRKAFPVTDTMLDQMSLFSRYGKLFGYVRILRSLSEKWSHEPEWMVSLRNRLNLKLEAIRQTFGSTH